MKHNKKRNTAFIYETLSRLLTKSIVEKNTPQKAKVLSIIKEFFRPGTILRQELDLYKILLETNNLEEKMAEKMLNEVKAAYAKLDGKDIFTAQSKAIAAINKEISQEAWATFVPNFKSLASVNAIFNSKTSVKKKVLFEQAIVNRMSEKETPHHTSEMKPLDNLTYHSFIQKFNNKYGDLLQEQKDLLNRYITSFADDGFELRVYLNEEIYRLKDAVTSAAEGVDQPMFRTKLIEIREFLDGFRKREFTGNDLNRILKTQELVKELGSP
jgi:hypothetical protein